MSGLTLSEKRFKLELVTNVSHDLRTPLTAIIGYGELLKDEKLSGKGTEQLKRLNARGGYMEELVNSIFELTKVTSGGLPTNKEDLNVVHLLEQRLGQLSLS